MIKVIKATYLKEFKIKLLFTNNIKRVIDLQNSLNGKIYKPLKDIEKFKNFKVDYGTIIWENEADFAPEYLFLNSQSINKKSKLELEIEKKLEKLYLSEIS